MDCLVYKKHKQSLCMGHYLIVADKTHLPSAKIFSYDTLIERDICYNVKGVWW